MRHVRDVVIYGLIIGLVLAVGAIMFLTAVGNSISFDRDLDYGFLRLSDSLVWADSADCGLEPVSACLSMDYAQTQVIPTNELHVVQANPESLQPYGMGAEDGWTETMELQPTDPRQPMVTLNGALIQGGW